MYEWFLSKRISGSGSRVMAGMKSVEPVASIDDPQHFIILTPNPLQRGQQEYVLFNSRAAGMGRMLLINTNGSVLNNKQVSLVKGFNRITINTANLSGGVYLIKVYDTGLQAKTLKLIIN